MRNDLVERAEAAAKAEAEGEGLPLPVPERAEGKPKARPAGRSGAAHVYHSCEAGKVRAKPYKVEGAHGARYLARVATAAEGVEVAEAFRVVWGAAPSGASPRAMRRTAKRMAADKIDGQGALPLGDGLEGLPAKPKGKGRGK